MRWAINWSWFSFTVIFLGLLVPFIFSDTNKAIEGVSIVGFIYGYKTFRGMRDDVKEYAAMAGEFDSENENDDE